MRVVRTRFSPKAQIDGQWPKESKTMNLLESGLEPELSMSQIDNDHSRLVIIGKSKTNSFEQEKFSLVKSEEGLFLYIFLILIQKLQFLSIQSFLSPFSDPLCNGVLLFYIPFPSFISTLHVQVRLPIFLILVPSAHS